MSNKDWGNVVRCEPQIRRHATFYQYHSRTIQQREAKIKEKNENVYTSLVCCSDGVSVSRIRKNTRTSSFYRWLHINEEIIALQRKLHVVWKKT